VNPRTFCLWRDHDVSGVSGTGMVAVGVQFPSGRCVIEWLPGTTDVRSLNIYQSIEEIKAINGHNGNTRILFNVGGVYEEEA